MKNLTFPGLPRVLIVDDEDGVREGLRTMLQKEGLHVETAGTAEEGLRRLDNRSFDLVFLDLHLPGADGLSTLAKFRRGTPPADIVVLTGYGTVSNTVEAMRKGASDVIEKPFAGDRILAVVRRVLETRQLKNELTWLQDRVRELTATELVGLSTGIREVQTRIDQVAHAPDTTVLITGQSGTGKELVARCVHERSARRHGPFVAINCAALTEALLEAELFGYEPGAFTGAAREGKDGLFAVAAGGTLFLDEIGEMEPTLQAKLLRVLQERTFRRVGGVQDVPADVRIIASTNRDLRQMVQGGRFREDLFYRLNVMSVHVPPLRERAADVPLLSHFFLDQIGRQMGKALSGFTEEAMETLTEYTWPGNVRELRNAIEHACIVCPSGMIDEIHLPKFTGGSPDGSDEIDRTSLVLDGPDRSIRALESQLVARVLEDTAWNISRAAAILGINRTTLYNKIRAYDLGRRPGRSKVMV
ncbi:MAG: sigma-54-dependent Fis family transcriptional regulator [Planctomycetes bacterium]|nr:sigma-54-dependent Fis family transcriptional regulator [Planctomycetota bacterium]MBZ0154501.1 sigma-54 dependent transcriptional regulator [Planctomycetota bacterium]MCC7397865.1 sigma-54-dependent Fis family transcriptional regulator [Planctomycetota bacterium]